MKTKRDQILELLTTPKTASEIADIMKDNPKRISAQLAALKKTGRIRNTGKKANYKDGKKTQLYETINNSKVDQLSKELSAEISSKPEEIFQRAMSQMRTSMKELSEYFRTEISAMQKLKEIQEMVGVQND